MPKKFANENPKVTAARERKAETKKVEADKKQKAADDAYWADDDKLANRKLQRKDDAETKRADAVKRKEENRKLAEEEMSKIGGRSTVPQKVTRHEIDRQREAALLAKLQEDRRKQQEKQKIEVLEHIEENLNKMTVEGESARTVEEAITVLGGTDEDFDKHPEKRMRAAYLAFEEKRLPQLKTENPTFRLSQLKQLLKKEWMKSPENPLNQRLMEQ